MAVFDAIVGARGLRAGGMFAVQSLTRSVAVRGRDNIPRQGPLLVVSNHPGLADAAALFAELPRTDLRVIAARRLLLAALPETARHLLFVPGSGDSRLPLVRQAARHLNAGGAVLTFPAGRIEPDPAVRSGAEAALAGWSSCVNSFARLVPTLTIVPVIVSGVLSPAAVRHPLTRLRRSPRDREWLAATLQMSIPRLANTTPGIVFGAPIHVPSLVDGQSVDAAVRGEARRLIETVRLTVS